MLYRIAVMPQKRNIEAAAGENLLQVLRDNGLPINAVCGGNGSCGNKHRMVACSTAAGPALEGAGISCGIALRRVPLPPASR